MSSEEMFLELANSYLKALRVHDLISKYNDMDEVEIMARSAIKIRYAKIANIDSLDQATKDLLIGAYFTELKIQGSDWQYATLQDRFSELG